MKWKISRGKVSNYLLCGSKRAYKSHGKNFPGQWFGSFTESELVTGSGFRCSWLHCRVWKKTYSPGF